VTLTSSKDNPEFYEPTWEIQVYSVPRSIRREIHELLVSKAMPAARNWLDRQKDFSGVGSCWLEISYDIKLEELKVSEGGQLVGSSRRN
jgi:hypothetical protein